MGLTLLPCHLNLLAPFQDHTGLQPPAAELFLLAVQEGHVQPAKVPVGSLCAEGEAPTDGIWLAGMGQVVGAGALEVGHSPIEGEVMRVSGGHTGA